MMNAIEMKLAGIERQRHAIRLTTAHDGSVSPYRHGRFWPSLPHRYTRHAWSVDFAGQTGYLGKEARLPVR